VKSNLFDPANFFNAGGAKGRTEIAAPPSPIFPNLCALALKSNFFQFRLTEKADDGSKPTNHLFPYSVIEQFGI
jgi:hypothetical protein